MNTIQADVCIVGGGPAGVLLGYLLAKNGSSVVVIERSAGGDREFRGEHVNVETEAILKEHGLYDKIERYGLLKMERIEYFVGKDIVKTIEPGPGEDHVGIHIPQTHLLQAIIEKSLPLKTYKLLLNTTVIELIENENGQYTGVKAKQAGDIITINSSFVVGADGRYSTVRKLAQIPYVKRSHGYDVLWAKFPAPDAWKPMTRMLNVDGHQLALFTQTNKFIQIGWNVEEGSYSSLRKKPLQSFLAPLIESFPELKESVAKYLHSWKDFVYFQVQSSRSETWVKDGLVIMGDAAHTMTPTGAIGINCAMKDANVLAPILLDALSENNTSAERLKRFEQLRRGEIDEQQENQIIKESSFTDHFVQVSFR